MLSVYFQGIPPEIDKAAFRRNPLRKIYVPQGARDRFAPLFRWYVRIIETPEGARSLSSFSDWTFLGLFGFWNPRYRVFAWVLLASLVFSGVLLLSSRKLEKSPSLGGNGELVTPRPLILPVPSTSSPYLASRCTPNPFKCGLEGNITISDGYYGYIESGDYRPIFSIVVKDNFVIGDSSHDSYGCTTRYGCDQFALSGKNIYSVLNYTQILRIDPDGGIVTLTWYKDIDFDRL